MNLKSKKSLTVKVNSNGSVHLLQERRTVAMVAPEIFTEGWAKQSLAAHPQGPYGIVPLAGQGRVGLKTVVKAAKTDLHLRFTLTPLETVKAIHLRLVVSLPYKDWLGSPYRLDKTAGRIPAKKPANIRLAEAQSTPLTLGPSSTGLTLGLKAPRLYTVLQDNRQWSPFLQAFVNRHEPAEPAWQWKKDRKKAFNFTLSFPIPVKVIQKKN
jgi:hypothetical protein